MTLFKKQSDPMDVTKYHWIIDKVIETIKNSKISADYKDNKSQNQIAADILSVMIENDVTNGDYRYIVSTVKTIFDLIMDTVNQTYDMNLTDRVTEKLGYEKFSDIKIKDIVVKK